MGRILLRTRRGSLGKIDQPGHIDRAHQRQDISHEDEQVEYFAATIRAIPSKLHQHTKADKTGQ